MGMVQGRRYCRDCEKKTLHEHRTAPHGWCLLFSILTLGLFVPVWVVLIVMSAFSPWRCQFCGSARVV